MLSINGNKYFRNIPRQIISKYFIVEDHVSVRLMGNQNRFDNKSILILIKNVHSHPLFCKLTHMIARASK